LAIELATRERDEAAKHHAQAIRDLGFAQQQMVQLQSYAADTDTRWVQSPQGGQLSGELIRHHYQFMERLQQAMHMQEGVLGDLQRAIDAARQVLLQREFRLSGLKQVLATRQADLNDRMKRREQRQTDEIAAQRHQRLRGQRHNGEQHDY
jgi:flagellar FliJ protein